MRTILVLGNPAPNDLDAVLDIPNNLVLIVTDVVPTTPPPRSTVLVLLLNSPLAIHASGALRLASVLERAHRIAKSWRSRPLSPAVYILTEHAGEFQMQTYPSPRSSSDVSSIVSTSTKVSSRPFDVLINFIPPIPDPAKLKHAVLVTSLANPFLSTPPTSRLNRHSSSSFSFRTFAAPPADADALLVHVLPTPTPTKLKIAASIEQVILSFTVPAHASLLPARPASVASLHNTPHPRIRAYLLPSSVLADPAGPPHEHRAPSVACVLLEGHVTLIPPPPAKNADGGNMAGIGAFGNTRAHQGRAWIGTGEDVAVPPRLVGLLEDLKLQSPPSPTQPRSPLSNNSRVSSPGIPRASPIKKPREVIVRKTPPRSELPTPPASLHVSPSRVYREVEKKHDWEVVVEKEHNVWHGHRYHYAKAAHVRASIAITTADSVNSKVRWWKRSFVRQASKQ